MDKKIILSLVIVAIIGIVAASYQINQDESILNPLASVDPDDTPITDTLAAPAKTATDTVSTAQQQAQEQQAKDQQSKAQQANEGQQQAQEQPAATKPTGNLITSDNPVTTPTNTNGQNNNGTTGNNNNNNNNNGGGSGDTQDGSTPSNSPNSPNRPNTPDTTSNSSNSLTPVDNSTLLSVNQAYTSLIQEISSDIKVNKNSGVLQTAEDGQKCVVFDATATNAQGQQENIKIWVPRDPDEKSRWYIPSWGFIHDDGSDEGQMNLTE